MSRILAVTFSVASIFATPLMAQQYVCADESAIGFNWVKGQWVEARFTLATRVIKKLDPSDVDARLCNRSIEANGYSTDVVYDDYSGLAYGCYQNTVLGTTPSSADLCREIYKKDTGEMWAVRCDGWDDFDFAPNGEYVEVRTRSIPDPSNRDSLAMIVGKCSALK